MNNIDDRIVKLDACNGKCQKYCDGYCQKQGNVRGRFSTCLDVTRITRKGNFGNPVVAMRVSKEEEVILEE